MPEKPGWHATGHLSDGSQQYVMELQQRALPAFEAYDTEVEGNGQAADAVATLVEPEALLTPVY